MSNRISHLRAEIAALEARLVYETDEPTRRVLEERIELLREDLNAATWPTHHVWCNHPRQQLGGPGCICLRMEPYPITPARSEVQ